MKSALNSVKVSKPRSNAFDLSHDVKLSCNMAELIPVCIQEAVPGDRFRISGESVVRFAPLIAPMMHRVDVSIHYFFVPNRILWPNWETWITGGSQDGQFPGVLPAHPTIKYGDGIPGASPYTRLMDYMGLPDPQHSPNVAAIAETVSAFPFAAYQKVYNDYYRDENLITPNFEELQDGDNTSVGALLDLRTRAWGADYFTKALPFAQKGVPVSIPLASFEDVSVRIQPEATGPTVLQGVGGLPNAVVDNQDAIGTIAGSLFAETSALNVDSATINDLRQAFRLQEWLERNARGGTRYSELIRAHFGVTPQDARLQRPEYITGIKNPVQISEVLNTTGETLPQGNMAGHGISYSKGKYGKYFCHEHGYLIGIMSIMPTTAYFQGIPRHFSKFGHPTELYWESFAHLGEQEIKNKELFAFQDGGDGEGTFGYIPRYQEYKTPTDRVCGEFKTSLAYWHMGRYFVNPPNLNSSFVTADPTNRIFAVTDPGVQKMYAHIKNDILAIRPMPVFGTPSF